MDIKSLVPQKMKNYYHLAQAVAANLIYGFPSKQLEVIGITGTNGKTTTTQMITRILEEAGEKVAMASTINFKIGSREWVNETKFTTLSSFSVQKFIKKALEANCKYLVLETSSHSLDQYRVWGVKYDTAVITNVTREHLDYHKSMEEYRLAKHRLFRGVATIVVNLDMEKPYDYIVHGAQNKYGYTTENRSDTHEEEMRIINADELELEINHSRYKIGETTFDLKMPGRFNVENALAATCVAMNYKIDLLTVKNALEKITGVPGRMEHVPNERGLDIIIDYALTPDSMQKLYRLIDSIRSHSSVSHKSRIISVFGSCGERDRGKRPIMGQIVDKFADYIILTNEDPYGENPVRIINEIAAGIKNKKEGENFWQVPDRREAIKKALVMAEPGDIVVITGKGAEETMMIGKKMVPWNDKKVIEEILSSIKDSN